MKITSSYAVQTPPSYSKEPCKKHFSPSFAHWEIQNKDEFLRPYSTEDILVISNAFERAKAVLHEITNGFHIIIKREQVEDRDYAGHFNPGIAIYSKSGKLLNASENTDYIKDSSGIISHVREAMKELKKVEQPKYPLDKPHQYTHDEREDAIDAAKDVLDGD